MYNFVQRFGNSILRERESLSLRGQTVSVLTHWKYPFLPAVIGLRKACDTVVVTEKKEKREVGKHLENIFLLDKKEDT